jgi:uncharacterized protein YvpB
MALSGVGFARTQLALKAALPNADVVKVKEPLTVLLNQEISADLEATIEPAVEGSWSKQQTLLGTTAVTFKPKTRFVAGKTYKLRLDNLKRIGTGAAIPDVERTFKTQTPPKVVSSSPAAGAPKQPVRPKLSLTLDSPNQDVRQLRATLTPAAPLRAISSDDKTFTWEPIGPLKQDVTYTFTVDDTVMPDPKQQRLVSVQFMTVTPPAIVSARSGIHLVPGQPIDIIFDQPMNTSSTAFEFELKGKGSWLNASTYRFVPEQLERGKTYKYKVLAGIDSAVGGVMEADREFSIATNGAVTGTASPGGTGVKVGTAIRITFDQPVDHGSAQSRFSISPALAGSFSWSGNTMTYSPTGMAYETKYTYSVAPGVVPSWGLPSSKAIGGSFTTEAQLAILNVPLYKQAYGRSCELASLRMLLAYRGIHTTDQALLSRVGYNPRARNGGTWDNPNQMFVGYVDTYSWSQGYGVHAGPVANAAKSFGRNATAHFNVSASFIANALYAGNPVEFYGHISTPSADSWNTSSGVVQTTTSMHARVAYGVKGPADNPTGFYIQDPWTGGKFYWSTAQLMANMNAVPGISNQAVIVY